MWIPKAGKCAMCGAAYERMSPNQKFCDKCREINKKQYADKYGKCYRKDKYIPVVRKPSKRKLRKLERQNGPTNLDKAVQYYGQYGLELVQSFFNMLHKAHLIAKKNGVNVDAKAIDIIMSDFRENKIG